MEENVDIISLINEVCFYFFIVCIKFLEHYDFKESFKIFNNEVSVFSNSNLYNWKSLNSCSLKVCLNY